MKKLLALLIILSAIMLAACAPQETHREPPEKLVYHSKDEFYNEVSKAKENKEKKGDKTYHKIEEIEYYYDFKNSVKDIELDSVNVTYAYVALLYCDKEGKESGFLTLKCNRPDEVDLNQAENETRYLENMHKALTNMVETTINGHKALKGEEYWDDPFTAEVENTYTSNRYLWVEDGNAIFVRVPAWLLERYPEQTFFDIKEVKLKKLDEIN